MSANRDTNWTCSGRGGGGEDAAVRWASGGGRKVADEEGDAALGIMMGDYAGRFHGSVRKHLGATLGRIRRLRTSFWKVSRCFLGMKRRYPLSIALLVQMSP